MNNDVDFDGLLKALAQRLAVHMRAELVHAR
jgi:hypothetical protein